MTDTEKWLPPVPEGYGEWIEFDGNKFPDLNIGDEIQILDVYERDAKEFSALAIYAGECIWSGVVAYCVKLPEPQTSQSGLTPDQDKIIKTVLLERVRQDLKYGGKEHDTNLSSGQWSNIVHKQASKLFDVKNKEEFKRRATHIAAIGLAMLEIVEGEA